MTPEQSTNSGRLEDLRRQLAEGKALTDRLLDCQEAHLREISNLNAAQQSAEKRAEHFRAERDALQAELSSLKADMFVLNNDMGYTTGVLEDVLKQRDALQARIDWALAALKQVRSVPIVRHLIKILTGEGE